MRCGNCKDSHPTVQDVRDCYSAVSPTLFHGQDRFITEKQGAFIRKLVEERHDGDVLEAMRANLFPCTDPMDPEKAMTRQEASELIDALLEVDPPQSTPTVSIGDVEVGAHVIPDGTYTVVAPTELGEHVTLRLRPATWAKDLPAGSQVVEFLSGPDNEHDFTGFGFIVKGKPRIWKRYRDGGRPVIALHLLLDMQEDNVREAGHTYALASGRCYRCNRTLTVPASIHRGLGPVCAGLIEGAA
jgi:hypothetical protein